MRSGGKRVCSIDGCEQPHRARGFCKRHYQLWWTYGDPNAETGKHLLPAECSIDGCGKKPLQRFDGQAVCELHFGRLRRLGTIEITLDNRRYDVCQYCGSATGGSKFCDARCRSRHDRGYPVNQKCKICGADFVPKNKGRDPQTCSEECSRKAGRAWFAAWYRHKFDNDPAFRERVRKNEYKRKARKNGVGHEDIEPHEIFERDNWRCGLCSENIDMAIKWPHPKSPTIDHIIPLSLGGPHTAANVQAAHLGCNCSKGARPQFVCAAA